MSNMSDPLTIRTLSGFSLLKNKYKLSRKLTCDGEELFSFENILLFGVNKDEFVLFVEPEIAAECLFKYTRESITNFGTIFVNSYELIIQGSIYGITLKWLDQDRIPLDFIRLQNAFERIGNIYMNEIKPGEIYELGEVELIGKMPIRSEITVLSADSKIFNWAESDSSSELYTLDPFAEILVNKNGIHLIKGTYENFILNFLKAIRNKESSIKSKFHLLKINLKELELSWDNEIVPDSFLEFKKIFDRLKTLEIYT